MNKYILKITMALAVVFGLTACFEDRDLPILDLDGELVSAEFTSPATGNAVLDFESAETQFESFEWTASDYGVSVPKEYIIEAATDAEFSDIVSVGTTKSLNMEMTVSEINGLALSLGLAPFEEGDIFMRVRTRIVQQPDIDNLFSSPITRTVTPYITDFPSIYMIGDALKAWDPNQAVELYGSGPNEYSAIAEFNNGGAFRFFDMPDWGATSYNWTYFEGGTVDANFESAADGDTNLRFIGVTGFYRITVNLNTKVISMESVDQPELYMVGAGVPAAGWGWDSPVQLTWIQDGVWEVETEFVNDAFRFFTINNDWGSGRNYPYYNSLEYDIDSKLEDAMDGDNNFYFNGEPGTFTLVLNEIEKTITMAASGTAGPSKWIVGDATQAGWGWTSPVEAVQVAAGIFEADVQLSETGAFRFFETEGDWNSGTNFPTYIADGYIITSYFEDALDGDNNFNFVGVAGSYKIILNTNDKTITLTGGAGESMYIVGDGADNAGWNWDSPIDLMQIETGVFTATTPFNAAGAFRFFTIFNDWNSGLNYPYYEGESYSIDAGLVNAADGDSNFKLSSADGTYTITIDNNNKTITLQ